MYTEQEDMCDTGLALSLGHGRKRGRPSTPHNLRRDLVVPLEPSLTLSLSDEGHTVSGGCKRKAGSDDPRPARMSSPHSTVSSFSTVYPVNNIKREYVMAVDEAEMERVMSSRASDDEEEGGGARKKLRLTKEQSALLEDRFKEHSTLNPKQKQALAKQLSLRPRQVEVWFQNRRARTKLKQNEVDCEFLKRCCETLTNENRKLQKELQELRALKFAPPPLYMQLPASTLTMCPSCERVTGGGTDSSKSGTATGSFVLAPKPHFYSSFTHPAAC